MEERGITHVIHLAALQVPFVRPNPPLGASVNVVGTVVVFEAVRALGPLAGTLTYASSIAAYDPPKPGHEHEQRGTPATLYGVFKRANEETAGVYWADHRMPSIGLRPHTVYGLGRDQGVTSAPTKAMLAAAGGTSFQIPYGGRGRAAARARRRTPVHRRLAHAGRGRARARPAGQPGRDERGGRRDPRRRARVGGLGRIRRRRRVGVPEKGDTGPFVALLGDLPTMPLREGVAETIESFRGLLARGLVKPEARSGTGLDGATLALWRDVAVPLRDGTVTRADIWRRRRGRSGAGRCSCARRTARSAACLRRCWIPQPRSPRASPSCVQDVRGTGTLGRRVRAVRERGGRRRRHDRLGRRAAVVRRPGRDDRHVVRRHRAVARRRARPPALAALTPTITTDSVAEGWSFRGGVLESGFLRTLGRELARDARRSGSSTTSTPWPRAATSTAIAPVGRAVVQRARRLGLLGAQRSPDAVSRDLPALVIAGWYDCFLAGSLRSFADRQGARDRLDRRPVGSRADAHAPRRRTRARGVAGSPTSSGLRGRALDFYRAVLAGRGPPGPRVLAYLLGGRRWLELDSWPPPGARTLDARALRRGLLPSAVPASCRAPAGAGACRAACPAAASGRATSAPSLGERVRAAPGRHGAGRRARRGGPGHGAADASRRPATSRASGSGSSASRTPTARS